MNATGGLYPYAQTELSLHLIVGKNACPDSIAVDDLDGDGVPDLVALESPGFDMVTQEVVALHAPSRRVVWRALKGQPASKLALVNGVVVVATHDGSALAGLDARNGQLLWQQRLPGPLQNEPYDNTWNAPALTASGPFVLVEAGIGAHAIEARTGRIVVSHSGRLTEHGHDIPGIAVFKEDGPAGRAIVVHDLMRGREIYRGGIQGSAPLCMSADGAFAIFHADTLQPQGIPMTRAAVFDVATMEPRLVTWVTPSDDWNIVYHDGAQHDPRRSALLPGGRLLIGSTRSDEDGGITILDLRNAPPPRPEAKPGFFQKLFAGDAPPPKPPSLRPTGRIAQPRANTQICAIEPFGPIVVVVWQNPEDKKLLVQGLDAASLSPRWQMEAGGTNVINHTLRSPFGLLLPMAPGGRSEWSAQNRTSWVHVDPVSGAALADYAVPSLDCVRMSGKYLVAFVDAFTSGFPVIWDTERRTRAL
jgi:hypothetical protein